jgi:hypothetical protein
MRQGDSVSAAELYRPLNRGVRFLAARKLPASQVEGCVREVLDRVIRGVQSGGLGDPVRLGQYVRMHLTDRIREIQDKQMPVQDASDTGRSPCATDERRQVMQDLLLALSPSDRDSLIRFYVSGHDERRICRELRVPAAEFRALRVGVRSRFHELFQRGAIGPR